MYKLCRTPQVTLYNLETVPVMLLKMMKLANAYLPVLTKGTSRTLGSEQIQGL